MRLDPDVIMIGEVRDLPSAQLSFRAATTGHLVFTTLHANNSLNCVDRMVNMGMDPDTLLDERVLIGLISQRLVKRLCPHCAIPLEGNEDRVPARMLQRLNNFGLDSLKYIKLTGPGCPNCRKGTAGRTVVLEIVRPDFKLFELLRSGDRRGAHLHWLNALKGQTHVQHAIEKVKQGIVDPVMAERVVGELVQDLDQKTKSNGERVD
jgi:type II secretory ATPase GspE/PulE/Tfp pilus assembly ATPase PilB-like protein